MVCKICGRACWAARPAPVPEPGEPLPEFYRRAARQFRSELAADRTLQADGLEVAILSRSIERRCFKRFDDQEIDAFLS